MIKLIDKLILIYGKMHKNKRENFIQALGKVYFAETKESRQTSKFDEIPGGN